MQQDTFFNIHTTTINEEITLTISFVEYLKDVIFDHSLTIIPFTNGTCYNVYQDIAFKILDMFKEQHISASISIDNNTPSINVSASTHQNIQKIKDIITIIVNRNINRKFSLI